MRDHKNMPNTGERREITARANAKEAETVRESQKLVSKTKQPGIAEGRGVSNNSAKRVARSIRFPFAYRDLAEHGALRSGEVLKFGSDLMCRSNPHAPASQLVGPLLSAYQVS